MTKRHVLMAATIMTVVGSVVAIKPFMHATSVAAVPQAPTIRAHTPATSQPATMEIVPAPVIDATAEVFIGTGDGSEGSWVKPQ